VGEVGSCGVHNQIKFGSQNDMQRRAQARASLAELAHPEGSSTYWNLETNTSPFYGWGNAGRLETTALAVQALAALSDQNQQANEQVSRGVQYLLSHKDPYQIWYSTHATLAAVEALATAIPAGNDKGEGSKAILTVNGHQGTSVDLPAAKDVVGAIAVDLTKFGEVVQAADRRALSVLQPMACSTWISGTCRRR
jgi:hypothetical protein